MTEEEKYDIPEPLQSIGCQDLLEYSCSHCGWLRKRRSLLNQILNWPQAYVVLHKGCLYYFKNERAKSSAGRFSLYGYNSVYRASEIPTKEAPWPFKIVHSHEEFKTYFFAASSEKEMKVWMSCIKKELIKANGGSALYGNRLKLAKEKEVMDEKLDDSSFYQDIEKNIYDAMHEFVPSTDYQKKCSIKKQNEESDDEDLIDKRPPQPLPDDRLPFCSYPTLDQIGQPTLAPPTLSPSVQDRVQERAAAPPTPPRSRKNSPPEQTNVKTSAKVKKLTENLQKVIFPPDSKSPRLRRRGSYEQTDEMGIMTPSSPSRQVDFRHIRSSDGGGGSAGDEDPMPDLEEYWASIHFDDHDKTRAQETITAIGEDGAYLVRPENSGTGKVLVVFSEDRPKKYRIHTSPDGEFYLAKTGFHDKCLENLLCYYYEEELPTVKTKLKVPYKLHKNYKKMTL